MAKKNNGNNSHHHRHEHQSFFLIVAGGFLLLVLGYFLFADNPLRIASERRNGEERMSRKEKREKKRDNRKEKRKNKKERRENRVVIRDFSFQPETLTVKKGTVVNFVNRDTEVHSAVADNGSFRTNLLEQGENDRVTFNTPGTYTFQCELHSNMTGTIVVTE